MGRWIARLCAVLVALVATGCSLLPAGPPVVVLPGGDGFPELPVVLEDRDGLVKAVDAGPLEERFGPMAIAGLDEDTAVVTWVGGACDSRVRLRVSAHPASIGVGLATDTHGLGCNAAGVGRSVAITFRDPIGERSLMLDPAP
jgi:hypothetical protein